MNFLKLFFYFVSIPIFFIILLMAEILNIFSLLDRKQIKKIENFINRTTSFYYNPISDNGGKDRTIELITHKKLFMLNNNINSEDSDYSKMLKTIEKPTFQKIKNYCKFLVESGKADKMQKVLTIYKKRYKITSTCTFLNEYKNKTFNIIDIGSEQGVLAMWVLECMRILNIKVNNIILINNDETVLSRAIMHLEILKDKNTSIIPLNLSLDDISLDNFYYESDSNSVESLFVGFKDNKIEYKINNNTGKICRYHKTTIECKNIKNQNDIFNYKLNVSKVERWDHIVHPQNLDTDDTSFLLKW